MPLNKGNKQTNILINSMSGLLAESGWSVYISKFQRNSWVSFSKRDSGLCIYHMSSWSIFLISCTIPKHITFLAQSCLLLYSFSASLLYSLIISLTNSSLSPYNPDLHFFCTLSIFARHTWFLWHYFVLLVEYIHFLSTRFPISRSSRVQSP